MKRTTALAMVIAAGLALTPAAHAWINYIDFNDMLYPDAPEHTPPPPHDGNVWIEYFNEGGASFEDLGSGNFALRLDSPAHSDPDFPPDTGLYHANEYYVTDIPGYEKVGAARFRLHSFTQPGKENLLAISTSIAAPTITLVDGNYWIWSNLSLAANQPILDLGPAVVDEWHEVYIMATIEGTDPDTGDPNAGGAKVWWDGEVVFDGPVDGGGDVYKGGYVEFGSGCYWQTSAGTEVDFDWVGYGDVNDFPVPPGVTGDYNDDDKVDAADYVVLRKFFGLTSTLPNDPDVGTTVDEDQYNTWVENFGTMSMVGTGQSGAVPEPATIRLLLVTILAGIISRRPR